MGSVHQVVRGDQDAAAPAFARARELATRSGDRLTLLYVLRHLAFGEQAAGRTDGALELMTESTRLRREIGFRSGVAGTWSPSATSAPKPAIPSGGSPSSEQAAGVAEAAGAHGILRWVDEARVNLRPA